MKLTPLILPTLLCLVACSGGTTSENDSSVQILTFQPDKAEPYREGCYATEMIPLETTEASVIDNMPSLLWGEEYLYVHTQQQAMLQFTHEGDFVRKIGAIGHGAGEYLGVNDALLDAEKQQLALLADHKIYHYDLEGEFIGATPYDIPAFSFAKQGDHYWFYTSTNEAYSPYMVIRTDTQLAIDGHFLKQESSLFPMAIKAFSRGSRITFHDNFMNSVYYVEEDSLIASYRLDFGSLAIPEALFTAPSWETISILEQQPYAMIESYLDNGRYAFFLILTNTPTFEAKYYHLIVDKQTHAQRLILLENIPFESYLLNPQLMTPDNELIFLGYPAAADKINAEENPMVVRVKL